MMTERTADHGPDSPEDPSRAEERVALLALGRLPKIGPQRSRILVDHCGSERAALSAPDTDWEAVLGKSTLQRVNRSDNLGRTRNCDIWKIEVGSWLPGAIETTRPGWPKLRTHR